MGTLDAAGGGLTVAGFLLRGGQFEEAYVPAEPGLLNVFFGRNGAGKSVTLRSIQETLRTLRNGSFAEHQRSSLVGPASFALLRAKDQESAEELFGSVLAYLGWAPASYLPDEVLELCQVAISSRGDLEAQMPGAAALTADQVAALPLPQLRSTLIEALTTWIPGPPHAARTLATAMFSSPVIMAGPSGHIGLAFIPDSKTDGRLRDAAIQCATAPEFAHLASNEILADDFSAWVRRLAGLEPDSPVVLAHARLAHVPGGLFTGRRKPKYAPGSGWPQLGQSLSGAIARLVPRPVMFAPGQSTVQTADAFAENAVLDLGTHLVGQRWGLEDDLWHPFSIAPEFATRLMELIAKDANALLPRFVADSGTISLRVAHTGEWHWRHAVLAFTDDPSQEDRTREIPVDNIPSGMRTWVLAVIEFTLSRLLDADWTGTDEDGRSSFRWQLGSPSAIYADGHERAKNDALSACLPESLEPGRPLVADACYFLDEPEAHLHLTAQRDIVATSLALAESARCTVVATHSLSFLDAPAGRVRFVTLEGTRDEVQASAGSSLHDLAERATSLGITPSSLAMACRGVLVVEGTSDREVLARYGGIDLDRERIVTVVLQGVNGSAGIAELEFLHTLRIPIHVLFDHVRAAEIKQVVQGRLVPRLTKEEQELAKLQFALKGKRIQVNVLPFRHIDIIRAVPSQEIDWALGRLNRPAFIGWAALDDYAASARRRTGQKFKDTFQQHTGASVEQIIKCLREGDRHGPQSPELHGILAGIVNYNPSDTLAPGITVTDAH